MIDTRTAPYAAFLLRVTLGLLLLAHAGIKLFVFTPAGTAAYFAHLGLPGLLAYPVIALETVCGLALVAGVGTRLAALAAAADLLGATLIVHAANGFSFANAGGGWEYPAFWTVALVVQAGLGDGAWALGRLVAPRAAQLA